MMLFPLLVWSLMHIIPLIPANRWRHLSLRTDLSNGINSRKKQGAQKNILGITQEGHALFRNLKIAIFQLYFGVRDSTRGAK